MENFRYFCETDYLPQGEIEKYYYDIKGTCAEVLNDKFLNKKECIVKFSDCSTKLISFTNNKELADEVIRSASNDVCMNEYTNFYNKIFVKFQSYNSKYNAWVDLEKGETIASGSELKAVFVFKNLGGDGQKKQAIALNQGREYKIFQSVEPVKKNELCFVSGQASSLNLSENCSKFSNNNMVQNWPFMPTINTCTVRPATLTPKTSRWDLPSTSHCDSYKIPQLSESNEKPVKSCLVKKSKKIVRFETEKQENIKRPKRYSPLDKCQSRSYDSKEYNDRANLNASSNKTASWTSSSVCKSSKTTSEKPKPQVVTSKKLEHNSSPNRSSSSSNDSSSDEDSSTSDGDSSSSNSSYTYTVHKKSASKEKTTTRKDVIRRSRSRSRSKRKSYRNRRRSSESESSDEKFKSCSSPSNRGSRSTEFREVALQSRNKKSEVTKRVHLAKSDGESEKGEKRKHVEKLDEVKYKIDRKNSSIHDSGIKGNSEHTADNKEPTPYKNPVSVVYEMCQKNKWPAPVFRTIVEESYPEPQFQYEVVINGKEYSGKSRFSRKQEAKADAALAYLRSMSFKFK